MSDYQLHPLCTLFPEMNSSELSALRRFTGINPQLPAVFDAWMSDVEGFWYFRVCDASTREGLTSIEPMAEASLSLVLEEIGGRQNWTLEKADPIQAPDHPGFIYVIRSGDSGPVKIGWTTWSVESRIAELQCGNPEPLRVCRVINASRRKEAELHRKFASRRIRGEWFDASVLAEIE